MSRIYAVISIMIFRDDPDLLMLFCVLIVSFMVINIRVLQKWL